MEKTPLPQNIQKTILVVDDQAEVLKFVTGLLAAINYNVLSARDGPEAIRQAAEYTGTIHLLLSDFDMPEMTGMELATRLCESRPEMKVLLMSGFGGGMLVLNDGWHFLAKPFIASQLRTIVANLLSGGMSFSADALTP